MISKEDFYDKVIKNNLSSTDIDEYQSLSFLEQREYLSFIVKEFSPILKNLNDSDFEKNQFINIVYFCKDHVFKPQWVFFLREINLKVAFLKKDSVVRRLTEDENLPFIEVFKSIGRSMGTDYCDKPSVHIYY